MGKEYWRKVIEFGGKDVGNLIKLGATVTSPRHFIEDWYFTHRFVDIRNMGIQWRVRHEHTQGGVAVKIAIKSQPNELGEREVISMNHMGLIEPIGLFELLGFIIDTHRQKYRTAYTVNVWDERVEVQIDEYPRIPSYAELTGSHEAVQYLINRLDIPSKRLTSMTAGQILASYGTPYDIDDPNVVLFETSPKT